MIALAALLAGFGGLLLELVVLRRHGLLLGNTSSAAVLTLSVFLVGLGAGGLFWPRRSVARRRPLGVAALLYGLVAVTGATGDALLAALPPLPWGLGVLVTLATPGLPAFLMGGAFPLLFSALSRHAPPRHSAALVALNLLGSVAAVFLGGNFLIPQWGLSVSAWLAVSAYGVAALLVAVRSRWQRTTASDLAPPPLPPLSSLEWCAFLSGASVLGIEILMLRRLPFFLDGFQPTLSGVLAACLLGLTLGAVLGPPICRRLFGTRAVAGSLLLAQLAFVAGLHEWLAPWIAAVKVGSVEAVHLRVAATTLVAVGVPCLFLGATIPLCLERFQHPETRAATAGRLFFWQGLGSLVGALAVGHGLPLVLPESFFPLTATVLAGAIVVLLFRHLGFLAPLGLAVIALLAVVGVTGGGIVRSGDSPVVGSRYDRPDRFTYVRHRTDSVVTASVVYDRSQHGLILFTDQFRAAYIDQDSGYMTVLGHLPFLLRERLDRVAVIALGTGTTANAVSRWPQPADIDVVEISPAVVSLVDLFGQHGPGAHTEPAPFRQDPRTDIHVTDGRRYVAEAAPGSLDLISMEPLLPYAPGTVPLYTKEFYGLCHRALSEEGLMLQWVPTHSMPKDYFTTLLATFARRFPHHSVWLVNHSTLLVGSKRPHLPAAEELEARLAAAPPAAAVEMHEAAMARGADFALAFVGTEVLAACDGAADLVDDRPFLEDIGYWSGREQLMFLPDNLEVLQAIAQASPRWPARGSPGQAAAPRQARLAGLRHLALGKLEPTAAEEALGVAQLARVQAGAVRSTLAFTELVRARRELLLKELRVRQWSMPQPFDAAAFARGVDLRRVRRQLDRDPGVAYLWAVRALAESPQLAQHNALERALAVDPTFYRRHPELTLGFVDPKSLADRRGPLEDLAVLPAGEDLTRLATVGDHASGVAFRARFRVRVARAFLAAAARRPLEPAERQALAETLDPYLFDLLTIAVAARLGPRGERSQALLEEVVPCWRSDLPMPATLLATLDGPAPARRALADALAGRRSRNALRAYARLVEDADRGVRQATAVSLSRSFKRLVPYDPEASPAERARVAEKLRGLVDGE